MGDLVLQDADGYPVVVPEDEETWDDADWDGVDIGDAVGSDGDGLDPDDPCYGCEEESCADCPMND